MKRFISILLKECDGQSFFSLKDVEHAYNSFMDQQKIVFKNEDVKNIELFYINNPALKTCGQIVKSDYKPNMAGLVKVHFQNGKHDYIHIKFLTPLNN